MHLDLDDLKNLTKMYLTNQTDQVYVRIWARPFHHAFRQSSHPLFLFLFLFSFLGDFLLMFFFAHSVHCRHSENRWRNSLAHAWQLGQRKVATSWPLTEPGQVARSWVLGRDRTGQNGHSIHPTPCNDWFLAKTQNSTHALTKVPPLSWLRLFIVMGDVRRPTDRPTRPTRTMAH